jgi:hypothetical protein
MPQLAVLIALSSSACGESGNHHVADEDTGGVHSAPHAGGSNGTGGTSGTSGASGIGAAKGRSGAGGSTAGHDAAVVDATSGTGDSGSMTTHAADAGGSDAGAVGEMDGMAAPEPSCLDGITDYENAGPFEFETKTAGAVKLWIPAVPAGCKVPVVHLANGTGATCSNYAAILERLATHGFLAACYEDPNTSGGTQCVTALETAFTMYPDLADRKIGSIAHGGDAAFTCVQRAEEKWGHSMIYTGLAMQPESGSGDNSDWMARYAKITSPMFMVSALGTDGIVSQDWVKQAFDALSAADEAHFWTVDGLNFIPVPVAQANQVSIPWFRWKLLRDQKACAFFNALPTTDAKWAEAASQNAQPCM